MPRSGSPGVLGGRFFFVCEGVGAWRQGGQWRGPPRQLPAGLGGIAVNSYEFCAQGFFCSSSVFDFFFNSLGVAEST